jgi:hypothetical protein
VPAIDIDEELLAYLRTRVRDFHESPNSVLRRELGLTVTSVDARPRAHAATPSGQVSAALEGSDVPESLRQIFRVVILTRGQEMDRTAATVQAAREFGVARETVADKYTRQLGLTTAEFDQLLSEKDLAGLKSRLLSKFPSQRNRIAAAMQTAMAMELV